MDNKGVNRLAIVGLVLSFVLGFPGLIVSIIALVRIKRTGESGKEIAIVGIIVSSIISFIFFMSFASVIFGSLIWPDIQSDIATKARCRDAFDCKDAGDGYMTCSYCADGEESCSTIVDITCPID